MAGFRFKLGRSEGGHPRYTVLILPARRGRFRKLHVSRRFVVTIGLIGLVMAGAGLWAPHLLFRLQSQSAALQELGEQNKQLRERNAHFETALDEITRQLDGVENQAGRLAEELGLAGAAAAAGGEGPPRVASREPLDGELEALSGRSTRLESSLREMDEAFRTRSRLLSSTPGEMPVDGWFSHGFGWRKDPFTGARQFHRGIDIVNHRGTPVVATADGVVSRAVRVADLGKTVDISHGHGYVTRYAHLDEILVRAGQRIHRGELIGNVGSTGRSTGPHLHYEVFRDGRRVNPWKYLGQRGS